MLPFIRNSLRNIELSSIFAAVFKSRIHKEHLVQGANIQKLD